MARPKDNYLKLKMNIFRGVEYEVFPKIFEIFLTFHFCLAQYQKLVCFQNALLVFSNVNKKFTSRHGVVFDVVELFTASH